MHALTAVHETDEADGGNYIVSGEPCRRVAAAQGHLALFSPNRVVVYIVTRTPRVAAFVFRTLSTPEACQSLIAGVRPHVRLLATTNTSRRTKRLLDALRMVAAQDGTLDELDDIFFLKLASSLSRRTSTQDIVSSLLAAEATKHGPSHHRRRVQSLS